MGMTYECSFESILDCLHILGIFFSVEHVFSMECNHVCALGPSDCSLCATVVRKGRFGLVGMFPLALTSSLCATWLVLTKHGGVGIVGSLEMLLIVLHAFRLLHIVNNTQTYSVLNGTLRAKKKLPYR